MAFMTQATGLLYVCFFCSGLSGLVYQVVWVRMFGNVFGNTVYSASVVVAVFMLGLGAGSYVVGRWADRRYAARPESLLRVFAAFEGTIAALGLALAIVLPNLGDITALFSSYSRDAQGWFVLSTASHAARTAVAIVLLTPITLLMGGTLTLLIRFLVRADLALGRRRIAVLYSVNTAGAAAGALLADFALVPLVGLMGTQLAALVFNLCAAAGAYSLSRRVLVSVTVAASRPRVAVDAPRGSDSPALVVLTALALALSGFAAMGFEILWFRHFTLLLGGFRAVFSLLLTVILAGIAAGSLLGSLLLRHGNPARWLIAAQALFAAASLAGLAAGNAGSLREAIETAAATAGAGAARPDAAAELWFNLAPILIGVAFPALLMGFAYPLANAMIQRAEYSVGRRAGVLYLANTAGAVCGSLLAGFVMLPTFGIQSSATILAAVAALVVVPVSLATTPRPTQWIAGSTLVALTSLAAWSLLPANYVIARTLVVPPESGKVVTLSEGISEVIAVADSPGAGRTLFTNGHPMSSTDPLAQRYMRALAHIPLLSMPRPERVLVIGFGVGNTAHAATLHPTVQRVDIVDLSRHVLDHAGHFSETNGGVLAHPRVAVHVNDGRQHLQMDDGASYDLITLEPPPIVHAGVGALYSREFYRLARARLKPGGLVSQWIPVYQVPQDTALGMIRAFLDVFPASVLLSGSQSNLLLVGANGPQITLDPERVRAVLSDVPAVRDDLQRVDLGTLREIVATFVGSAETMTEATRMASAVTDDRPMQEYGVRSLLNFGEAAPSGVIDLTQAGAWCPACFVEGRPVEGLQGLETHFALLARAYATTPDEIARTRALATDGRRRIAGSWYLGATVPESADVHNILGSAHASEGRLDQAIDEFRLAVRVEPQSPEAHWNLGTALRESGRYPEAVTALSEAVRLAPQSARALNDLGIAFALQGRLDEAIERFEQALRAEPGFGEAQRNLATARRQQEQRAAVPR
jgi:spermidine synthase